jgi:hypothetical protein
MSSGNTVVLDAAPSPGEKQGAVGAAKEPAASAASTTSLALPTKSRPSSTMGATAIHKPSLRLPFHKTTLETLVENDAQSETSTRVRNSLKMDTNQSRSTSVEVMMDDKFHRLFDSEMLQIDKGPCTINEEVRFAKESLMAMAEEKLTAEDRTRLSALRSFTEIRDMMNTKFSFKEGRLSSTLDILAQYMRGQKILYLEAKAYCEFYLYRLMIPTIFISTTCSVISGIFNDLPFAAMAVASASAFNTLLLALINYFKLDARAEAHRMTAYSFDQLISECEFTSGKILLSNLVNDEELTEDAEKFNLKYVQDFMSLIENKVKEIKQKNQFIIPDTIRHSFPNIYYTNVFALVAQSQIQEMIISNQLKLACNAFAEVENQIIKGDRRSEVYLDYNVKLKQKNDLIEKILEHRINLLAFDQVLRMEIKKNRKKCIWLRICY